MYNFVPSVKSLSEITTPVPKSTTCHVLRQNSNYFERSGRKNEKMYGFQMLLIYEKQKLLEATCELMTCSKCGRQDYQMEAETGLCLVCVGKELEL